jgi:hypothetical protein
MRNNDKKDFGFIFEHSPRTEGDDDFEHQDDKDIKKLIKERTTLREFRFGKNVTFDPNSLQTEDKLFNADGNLKNKRDLENTKVVPKVMKLLKSSPAQRGV